MPEQSIQARFEQTILPLLDAAYNLARWLTGDETDAEDVAQEALLRAFRSFEGYRGGNSRAWLLTIVRNTAYTWLRDKHRHEAATGVDEQIENVASDQANPDVMLLRNVEAQMVRQAVDQLPAEYREAVVLRELEGLSYKEMADVCGVPIGTIMSRLSRARQRLQQILSRQAEGGVT